MRSIVRAATGRRDDLPILRRPIRRRPGLPPLRRPLRDNLHTIADLWGDWEITFTRQGQAGTGNGGRSATAPLPFDARAADIGAEVKMALVNWVRTFDLGEQYPTDDIPAICAWLAAREARWRGHAEGGYFCDEIGDVVHRLRHVVDTPPAMTYLGVCDHVLDDQRPCGRQMYARHRDTDYVCPGESLRDPDTGKALGPRRECGQWYDVAARRDHLLGRVLGETATITMCARVLGLFGIPIRVETVQSWARPRTLRTGRVLPPKVWRNDVNDKGESVYLIADIEALAREHIAARSVLVG